MKTDSDERTSLLSSDRPWWSPKDIRVEFGIAKSTVYDLIASGAFGCPIKLTDRPGSSIRVRRKYVESFVANRLAAMSYQSGIPVE